MTTPREVLLVTQHYAPRFEGGTESVVRAQARELTALGHSVRIVAGTDRPHAGRDVEEEEVDGLPVSFLPRLPDEPYDLALERPRLRALLAERAAAADVVHVHHWSTLSSHVVRDAAARAPVVVTLHDLFTTCPRFFRVPVAPVERCPEGADVEPCARCVAVDAPGHSEAALRAGLVARRDAYRAELRAARARIAPSRAHARRLAELLELPEDAVRVVGHGLSSPLGRVAGEGWDGTGPLRVLHPGHRTEVKGTRDLVRALAGLSPAERARVELVLLGSEVEPGFDDSLRAEAGDLPCRFAGPYDLASLESAVLRLGGVHLAALPSRVEESYGLVVDEAMALGLPAWVSDRGAPRERVGRAGRVLPAAEPAAWTAAFRAVLADPTRLAAERRALPERARTARDAARELDLLYAELLELPGAPGEKGAAAPA